MQVQPITIPQDRLASLRAERDEVAARARAAEEEVKRARDVRLRQAEAAGATLAATHLTYAEIVRLAAYSEQKLQHADRIAFMSGQKQEALPLSEDALAKLKDALPGGFESNDQRLAFVRGVRAVYESL